MSDQPARYHDVTLPIAAGMTVWPGDPPVEIEAIARIAAGDEVNVSRLTLSTHAGTHVDPPSHFLPAGQRLDDIPLERWIGPCWVARLPDDLLEVQPAHLAALDLPPDLERLLLRTANSTRRSTQEGTSNLIFAALTPAAARWIVERGIKLVGIDGLSIGPADGRGGETHRILLGNDVLVVEQLDLRRIDPGPYDLLCLPLHIAEGDGAPARVVLAEQPARRPRRGSQAGLSLRSNRLGQTRSRDPVEASERSAGSGRARSRWTLKTPTPTETIA